MKHGLILLTDPYYSPTKIRTLEQERFEVRVVNNPDEVDAAVTDYFIRQWAKPSKLSVKCSCGRDMVYCDTTAEGDVYRCIGRLPDGEWCERERILT